MGVCRSFDPWDTLLGCLSIVGLYHHIKGTPSTGNGAADVIDRYLGYGRSYNVHIDITTDKKEDNKE